MFFNFDNSAVRYIGRWGNCGDYMAATAPGSKFQIAFKGSRIVLKFDITDIPRLPHIWVSIDGGARIEANLDRYLSVVAPSGGEHLLSVVFKGGKECANRWVKPLSGVRFEGFEADDAAVLPPLNKKTIELIGDSITEGVVVDAYLDCHIGEEAEEYSKPVQDDFCGTYGFVAAEILNLEPIACGYGAVGVTKGGCGGVPKAADMYDFAFQGVPITYPATDYVLINHGTNDSRNAEIFEENYIALLDKVTAKNKTAKIACMIPFCGAFKNEIPQIIEKYNSKNGTDIALVDTTGWLTPEPIHPDREHHKIAGEKLAAVLKEKFSL